MDENDRKTSGQAPRLAFASATDRHDVPVVVESIDDVFLRDSDIADIQESLENEDLHTLEEQLRDLSPADTAEVISKIPESQRHELIRSFGAIFDPEVFLYLSDDLRASILEDMQPKDIAHILADLESDDALDMILPLEPDFQQDIIKHLSAKTRLVLEEGLSFPEESAGRLMQREFVAVPQFWTVGKTLDYMRAATDELPDDFFDIIVVSPKHHVVGEIPLSRIIQARRSEKLEALGMEHAPTIPATMDQEEVAHLFRREALSSAPVVDEDGRLLGVITFDDVIDVIDEEAEEDILKLGGVSGESDLNLNVVDTVKSRFKWLCVNLITGLMSVFVISNFEATIEQVVALAALMPIVASMGGNTGTQTMTVTVRALATKELSRTNMFRTIGKEMLVGMLNGTAFAMITGSLAGLWFQDFHIGLVIGMALIINLTVAGLAGGSIPLILNRLGADPAVASSVFLTACTDVIGFFSFLGLATLILI